LGIVLGRSAGGLTGFERIQRFHLCLLRVVARLRVLAIEKSLLRAREVVLRGLQMNGGLFSRARFFGNSDRLACITHFLHGRRRLAARQQHQSGEQESLYERFSGLCLHVLFLLLETHQRYQLATHAVKLNGLR